MMKPPSILPQGDRIGMDDTGRPDIDDVNMMTKWDFPWPVMDVLIGGRSSIDMPRLHVTSVADALEFMKSYGYDTQRPQDQKRVHAIKVEALAFIESVLIPEEWAAGLRPPEELIRTTDVCDLLLWASSNEPQEQERRSWACSLLRVMHTIAHLEEVHRISNLRLAYSQISSRFQKHIVNDEDGRLWFGGEKEGVELAHLTWKKRKTRQSMLLKLLHKPANVAETIYDVIGVRIVTKRLCDVMVAVRCLRSFNMVTFPNCNPTRARNTLIDHEAFRNNLEMLSDMHRSGKITAQEFDQLINQMTVHDLPHDHKSGRQNPHSSVDYRALQITCRQRVRAPDIRLGVLRKLDEAAAATEENSQVRKTLKSVYELIAGWKGRSPEEVSYFFPFEVQVMDEQSFLDNQSGEASHDLYKLSQIRTARRRVLREVLNL